MEMTRQVGKRLAWKRERKVVERRPMMRRFMLLALALGCSDEYEPDCNQPLSSTDDEGNSWPTYDAASAQLSDCAQLQGYDSRQRGACSDGKRFIRSGATFGGDTLYFDGETLIGRTTWSDVVTCNPWRYGNTRCNELDVEEIVCP